MTLTKDAYIGDKTKEKRKESILMRVRIMITPPGRAGYDLEEILKNGHY